MEIIGKKGVKNPLHSSIFVKLTTNLSQLKFKFKDERKETEVLHSASRKFYD